MEFPPKFVLVLRGATEPEAPSFSPEEARDAVERLRAQGHSLKDACRLVAETSGYRKNELYAMMTK